MTDRPCVPRTPQPHRPHRTIRAARLGPGGRFRRPASARVGSEGFAFEALRDWARRFVRAAGQAHVLRLTAVHDLFVTRACSCKPATVQIRHAGCWWHLARSALEPEAIGGMMRLELSHNTLQQCTAPLSAARRAYSDNRTCHSVRAPTLAVGGPVALRWNRTRLGIMSAQLKGGARGRPPRPRSG